MSLVSRAHIRISNFLPPINSGLSMYFCMTNEQSRKVKSSAGDLFKSSVSGRISSRFACRSDAVL